MKILNLEDNIFKHHDISKAIREEVPAHIDQVSNLEDGLEMIQEAYDNKEPYDLIITDMWFPIRFGNKSEQSGELLIEELENMGMKIPVIMCSSIDYFIPGILGSVHYSENENWEYELVQLVKEIQE